MTSFGPGSRSTSPPVMSSQLGRCSTGTRRSPTTTPTCPGSSGGPSSSLEGGRARCLFRPTPFWKVRAVERVSNRVPRFNFDFTVAWLSSAHRCQSTTGCSFRFQFNWLSCKLTKRGHFSAVTMTKLELCHLGARTFFRRQHFHLGTFQWSQLLFIRTFASMENGLRDS